MSAHDEAPHFDGPSIAGGSAWGLDAVLRAPRTAPLSTSIGPVDEVAGGMLPGEIWTVSGEAGRGVTSLITVLTCGIATAADVVIANGHVPTRTLAERLAERAGGDSVRISVTSWLRVPWLGDEEWSLGHADVVLLDTWDEMWRPPHWERSPEQRIADARWLRELARRAGTAVVLTQRRPLGVPRTPIDAVFDDVADVRLEVRRSEQRGAADLTVTSRRGAPWCGPVRVG